MKPILFSTEMVKAILEGRKTQTRRVIKPQPDCGIVGPEWYEPAVIKNGDLEPGDPVFGIYHPDGDYGLKSPYGYPGGQLWVRETWGTEIKWGTTKPSDLPEDVKIYYRTDGEGQSGLDQWRPSIFMPRWASRITLNVTNVRIERLWEISEYECEAEGIVGNPEIEMLIPKFHQLWDSINAKRGYGWRTNPWVWVVEFEREK